MNNVACIMQGRTSGHRFSVCGAFLFLLMLLVMPSHAADMTIRVLVVDTAAPRIPEQNEKVDRIGNKYSAVILNGVKYTGSIEVWQGERGLYVVSEIPLEEYLKGVVAAEVGNSWDREVLKAQAVAARTYALYQKSNHGNQKIGYDLTSSVLHQVYKGGSIPENIRRAVEDTRGQVLTWQGEPILAYYHSTSCDFTEEASEVFGKTYPYLARAAADCSLSPYLMWERKLPASDIEKALRVRNVTDIKINSHTAGGRVRDVRISRDGGVDVVPAKDLRRLLGWDRLPSTDINGLRRQGEVWIFEGRGFGHGVGMCQWSALKMAKDGATYRDILARFYPGADITLNESK